MKCKNFLSFLDFPIKIILYLDVEYNKLLKNLQIYRHIADYSLMLLI